jgi:surfactin synthase thioesterase subunit
MSAGARPAVGSEWLVRLGDGDSAPDATTLICFPFAGGNAHVFAALARALPEWIEVYAVQLPGRAMRLAQPLLDDIGPIVAALDRELAPLVEGPYALYGTSMGAFVAYEYARSARRRGVRAPRCLVAVAARAPHVADAGRGIHKMEAEELKVALGRYGGTPAAVLAEPELMELLLPMVRADFAVSENYVHDREAPLDIPIVALGGRDDPVAPSSELAGWVEHTTGRYEEQLFPGDHFFHRHPAVQAQIVRILGARLDPATHAS